MSVPPKELVGVCLNIMAEIRRTIERYEKRLDKVYQQAGGKSSAGIEGKGRKRRKMSNAERKDPDRIKKPRSTYIRFVMEARPLIQQEMPGISQADLMKELGKRWKELPIDQREEYKSQYEDEKRRIIEHAKEGGWIGEEGDMDDEGMDGEEGDPMGDDDDEDDGEGHELDEDEAHKRQRLEYHEHLAQSQLMQQHQAQLQHHQHLLHQQQMNMGMSMSMQQAMHEQQVHEAMHQLQQHQHQITPEELHHSQHPHQHQHEDHGI